MFHIVCRYLCVIHISVYAVLIFSAPFSFATTKLQTDAEKSCTTSIDENFVKQLFASAIEKEESKREIILAKLDTLSRAQLKKLRSIVDNDREKNDFINTDGAENTQKHVTGNSAMELRFAHWVASAIDDRLGSLKYDLVAEGFIGAITSGTTVAYYDFTSTTGKHFTVLIGEGSLAEDSGANAYEYDWECFPRQVRLFLVRVGGIGPNVYSVVKVVALGKKIPDTEISPVCKQPKR